MEGEAVQEVAREDGEEEAEAEVVDEGSNRCAQGILV